MPKTFRIALSSFLKRSKDILAAVDDGQVVILTSRGEDRITCTRALGASTQLPVGYSPQLQATTSSTSIPQRPIPRPISRPRLDVNTLEMNSVRVGKGNPKWLLEESRLGDEPYYKVEYPDGENGWVGYDEFKHLSITGGPKTGKMATESPEMTTQGPIPPVEKIETGIAEAFAEGTPDAKRTLAQTVEDLLK